MQILAADSSDSMQHTLRAAIEVLGYGTLVARTSAELMQLLPAHHPEVALIVLEWGLPGADTHDLIARITRDGRFGSIPIMVTLSDDASVDAIAAFQAGAVECVNRPANEQDLITRMLECLSQAA
jgi:CheY-like chemotaxis protein